VTVRELDLDDAPDRPATLDGSHGDRDLIPGLEALVGPSAVLHVRRIARFHDPVHDLSVITLDVELQERVRIGPDPLRDDAFQDQTLGRVVLERGGAVMGRYGTRGDQKSGHQRDERDHCLSH
jgi:hypothetical protein